MSTSKLKSVYVLLYFLVLSAAESSEVGNSLVQLYDCTCVGFSQIYECTVLGAGTTIWQGSAFNCSQGQNSITLRHSQYTIPQGATGQCNDGAIMAKSAGVVNNCHVSLLNITVGEEMDGTTVECVHRDILSQIERVGQKHLNITRAPYALPVEVRVERVEKDQLTFSWNEVTPLSRCPYIQYIITAINCGTCPNVTPNTTVMCSGFNVSIHDSSFCRLVVQTELCGSFLGEKSRYAVVNIIVPKAPRFKLNLHYYAFHNVTIEIVFNDLNTTLSENVDGSPSSYIATYSDYNSGSVCNSVTAPASSCENSVCSIETEIVPPCSLYEDIAVTLSAVNVFGQGPPSEPVIFRLISHGFNASDAPPTCNQDRADALLPITVSLTVPLAIALLTVIVCMLVNIKLCKEGAKLKTRLRSQQNNQSREKTPSETNAGFYEELDIDINRNAAYSLTNIN